MPSQSGITQQIASLIQNLLTLVAYAIIFNLVGCRFTLR